MPGAVPRTLSSPSRWPHSGALVSFSLDLVFLEPRGAGYRGRAGNRVSYQLNPNRSANLEQEDLLFLASGAGSKARVDYHHIQPPNTLMLKFHGSISGERRA